MLRTRLNTIGLRQKFADLYCGTGRVYGFPSSQNGIAHYVRPDFVLVAYFLYDHCYKNEKSSGVT